MASICSAVRGAARRHMGIRVFPEEGLYFIEVRDKDVCLRETPVSLRCFLFMAGYPGFRSTLN
jgi:hypothetical protein